MRATYVGHETLTFSDYRDLKTGRTLVAEPGSTYDIAPAGAGYLPDVPEPWFTAAEWPTVPEVAEGIPAEPAAGEAPADDPEAPAVQESQQF